MSTENRGGEAHTHNINNNNAFGGGGGGQGGNFPRAIVPIQDVSEILSKYDFKEKIGTGGTTSREYTNNNNINKNGFRTRKEETFPFFFLFFNCLVLGRTLFLFSPKKTDDDNNFFFLLSRRHKQVSQPSCVRSRKIPE
jgi:hypothetical protein